MTTFDSRELRDRIRERERAITGELADIHTELDRLRSTPSPSVLKRERELITRATELKERFHLLRDRWLLLVAYEYQARHGFPWLNDAQESTSG